MVQPLVNGCRGASADSWTPGNLRPCWAALGLSQSWDAKPAPPAGPSPPPLHRHPDLETRLLLVPWLPFLPRKISPPPRASSHAATAFIQPSSQHLERSHGCEPPCVRAFVRTSQPAFTPFRAQHIVGRTAPLIMERQLMGSGSEFPFQHSSVWIPNLCLNI